MSQIEFSVKGRVTPQHDAAIILPGDDPMETLVEAIVGAISTDIEIQIGEQTIFLAMLQNPEHWESDWKNLGIEDPYSFVDSLIEET